MTGGTRILHLLTLAVLLVYTAGWGWGQSPSSPPPALDDPALAQARNQAKALERQLPEPKVAAKPFFELSAEQQERLKKYLPKTWLKLRQREPLHILAVGDNAFAIDTETATPAAEIYPAVFAKALADRFFYTGGVQTASGAPGKPAFGPAITFHPFGHAGGGGLNATGMIDTSARQMPVDLVLICQGQRDAEAALPPPAFARAIESAIDAARKAGAEVILCGPWLPMTPSAEAAWGGMRPLTDTLREVAAQESVLFADLGNFDHLLRVPDLGEADAPQVFSVIEGTYRDLFREAPAGEFLPREALHQRIGHSLLERVLHGRPEVSWKLSAATATATRTGELELRFAVENLTDQELSLTLLPLIAQGWRPTDVTPRLILPAAGKQTVTVIYAHAQGKVLALEEAVARLPLLVTAGSQVHIEDLRAPIQPLALVWNAATLFNQEEAFAANCTIVNNSPKDLSGDWQADLAGVRLSGQFTARAGGAFPLDLRFELADLARLRVMPLVVRVSATGLRLTSERQVEVVPNVGLAEPVPLRSLPGRESPEDSGVSLRAAADRSQLTLTCTVADPSLLQPGTEGGPAWQLDLNLDARSYGKRLERGATATLRVTGSAADGPAHVHPVAPWAFGDGYAAGFAPEEFQASLTTAPDGRKVISLKVPKSYLYLHEWALGNGNSQLGINVRLTLRQGAMNGPEKMTTYALSVNAKPVEDVESLVVLELSEKPTQRVTVNLY